MREPMVELLHDSDIFVPMSEAPAHILHDVVNIGTFPNCVPTEFWNEDFRRRYAAILLAERGQ